MTILTEERSALFDCSAAVFTHPTSQPFLVLVEAAIIISRLRTVAGLLRTADSLAPGHDSSDRRVFSKAYWSALRLACVLADTWSHCDLRLPPRWQGHRLQARGRHDRPGLPARRTCQSGRSTDRPIRHRRGPDVGLKLPVAPMANSRSWRVLSGRPCGRSRGPTLNLDSAPSETASGTNDGKREQGLSEIQPPARPTEAAVRTGQKLASPRILTADVSVHRQARQDLVRVGVTCAGVPVRRVRKECCA